MRVGIVGASGYTGAELLRLAAGHPELDVVLATGDTQAGTAVADLYPSLRPAYPDLVFAPYSPEAVDGLDLVFCGLPHGASQAIVPELTDRVRRRASTWRPTSGCRTPPLYPQWYGEAHTAPELLADFAYGLPELFRDELVGRRRRRRPRLLPDGRLAGAGARWCGPGSSRPTGIIVDAASGVSGAGRPPKPTRQFCTVDEDFTAYGLLDHRHTPGDRAGARRPGPVHPPPGPDEPGHPGHLLRPARRRPRPPTTLLGLLRDAYADEPFVVVIDGPPSTKATLGSNTAHVTARARRAHRLGRRPRRHRQPGQGRVRPGRPVRQPRSLGLARDRRPPPRRGVPVSVTAAAGVRRRRRRRAGIKAVGDPDLSLVATADGRPVAAAAVFTANKMTAAPVLVTRAHLDGHRRPGRRRRPQQRQRQRRHRRSRAGRRRGACARHVAAAARLRPRRGPRLLDRPDRLSRCRSSPWSPRHPRPGRRSAHARRRRRRGRGHPAPPTPCARRSWSTAPASPSAAWPRARPCSPRTWRRCSPCSPPTPPPSPPTLQTVLPAGVADSFNAIVVDGCTSTNDTVLLLASGRRRPGRRRRPRRRR